jgi:hypothetical protein
MWLDAGASWPSTVHDRAGQGVEAIERREAT